MSANPHANGGLLLRDLRLPDFRDYAVDGRRAGHRAAARRPGCSGTWLRDVIRDNPTTFRLFGPDETASNRLDAVFEATDRAWMAEIRPTDEHLAPDGRVMEVLSEHLCQGWLEGYLLTGRHGLFNCYEAFIHVIDSMFNQHAKWLKMTREIPWRRPIASLNYLLTSHVWRQDHNGFSHQDPGFIDHVVNKKAEVIRVYLPPDANMPAVGRRPLPAQPQLRQRHRRRQAAGADYLSMDDAILHCTRGHRDLGLGEQRRRRAGRGHGLLRRRPDARDARRGRPPPRAPAGPARPGRQRRRPDAPAGPERSIRTACPTGEFDALFTTDRPIIFAYHGYPWLIHRLTYRRTNHANLHVRGYKEEGTVTTPFDMVMRNDLDRFHLVMDVIDRVPGLGSRAAPLRQQLVDERPAGAGLRPRARRGPGRDPRLELAELTVPSRPMPGARPRPERRVGTLKATVLDLPDSSPRFDSTVDWSPGLADDDRASVVDAVAGELDRCRRGVRLDRRRRLPRGPRRRAVHGADAASTTRWSAAIDDLARPRATPQPGRRSRRSGPAGRGSRTSRTWPRSTPPSTRRCPTRPDPLPGAGRMGHATAASGATASTACRSRGRSGARGRAAGAARRRACDSSSPTSAAAARSPRSTAVDRSTPRWA